jgi:hypothetical protein
VCLSDKVKMLDLLVRRHVSSGSWVALWEKLIEHPQFSTEPCILSIYGFFSMMVSLELSTYGYQGSTILVCFMVSINPISLSSLFLYFLLFLTR